MIDPVEFFDLVSDKANRDSKLRGNFLAYIDENYDPSRYPQELPRVMNPGQPLSHKGYVCLDSYRPMPGDRVLLVPAGVSDYVIVGATEPSYEDQEDGVAEGGLLTIYPGQSVLRIDNHGYGQTVAGGGGNVIRWNQPWYNPLGFTLNDDHNEITPPPGLNMDVRVLGSVGFPTGTSGSCFVNLELGGAAVGGGQAYAGGTPSDTPLRVHMSSITLWLAGPSSYIRFWCAAATPGSNNVYGTAYNRSVLDLIYAGDRPRTIEI